MSRSRISAVALATTAIAVVGVCAAAPASAKALVITRFTVSPTVVTAAGHNVTFTEQTTGATACRISSSIPLNTMPATVPCGSSTKTIGIPGNRQSTSATKFVFTLTASHGTSHVTKSVTVTRNAAWPQITAVSWAIDQIDHDHDKLRIHGAIKYAKTCKFTSSPALPTLPYSEACADGGIYHEIPIAPNRSGSSRSWHVTTSATSPTGVTVKNVTIITQPTGS